MANSKSAPARPVIQYHKFNVQEEVERVARAECISCAGCDGGVLLKLLAEDRVEAIKAEARKERRIRRAYRRGNLITFPNPAV